ncbi:MAG: glycosyltransferase family 39 protein [Muribaculaceae bacterium]|nr:glycosyltransferase family 39 protein [Muribaculaceae bacterium]
MIKHDDTEIPGGGTILFIALALLLLPWLGLTLFYSKGEPREAIVAMSMLQSGEWILPLSYGADLPYKPPFVAWIIAVLSWLLNGGHVTEYLARLPSALAAMAMVMGGYAWARRERGMRFALIFSFVTMCSFEVFRASVACRLDMVLTACMVGAIYIMYYIRERAKRRKWLLYIATVVLLTCATLTKGPVGALLPCFVMGVYRLLRGDGFFSTLAKMLGLALLALAASSWWYILAWQRGGEEFYELMYEENIGRLLGHMSYDSHLKPFWYNFVTLIAGLLPWTLLLLMACFGRRRLQLRALSPAALLSLVAAVVVVGFYCIPASKRSVYLLPAYPFICYGIANILDGKSRIGAVKAFTWTMAVLAVLAPIALVALQIWPLPKLAPAPMPWWAYAVLAVPAACGVAWMCNRHTPVGHLLCTVWALYVAYLAAGMPAILNPRSDFRAVERLTEEPAAAVISLDPGMVYRFYSLNYYLGDRIRAVATPQEAAAYPPGTRLIFPDYADTTGLGGSYIIEPLLDRSADHRHRILMGIHK